jgi:hypothetical protein
VSAAVTLQVEVDYEPRSMQREFHDALRAGKRHALLVWHRRGGKTAGCMNQLIRTAATSPKPLPRCSYVAPYLNQAKKIAWDGITGLREFAKYVPGVKFNESELRADFPNGGRVQLLGADKPDTLRGPYLDGLVLDEFAQIDPQLRTAILLPALADREGYEIIAGTPKGQNHFYELYQARIADPNWYVSLRRASETGLVLPEVLADALAEQGQELYSQEFECSWLAASRGTYYAKLLEEAELQGRITSVPHDVGLRVWTAWDLGIGDATAIWFVQQVGREVRAIDYYEAEGEGLEHYAKMLAAKPYLYAEHLVPHDADHRTLQTGKTLVDMARPLGLNMRVVPKDGLEDGIEQARRLIPRCWFDREKTAPGLKALRAYQRRYNQRLNEYLGDPQHDWSSHGSDAWRYLAVGLRPVKLPGESKPKPSFRWVA